MSVDYPTDCQLEVYLLTEEQHNSRSGSEKFAPILCSHDRFCTFFATRRVPSAGDFQRTIDDVE